MLNTEQLLSSSDERKNLADHLIKIKFKHWKYEDEVRVFASLDSKDPTNNLYFSEFSGDLKLSQVILGRGPRLLDRIYLRSFLKQMPR